MPSVFSRPPASIPLRGGFPSHDRCPCGRQPRPVEAFAQLPDGTRAVPVWPASRHGEGKPSLPERREPKIDRHLPPESRDLQGNPASGAGRRGPPKKPCRPRPADDAPPDPRQVPEDRLKPWLVSGPKAAAPCGRRSEDRLGQGRKGNRSTPGRPLASLQGPKTRRSPVLRAASPSSRNSRERTAPPLSGAFTCKEMVARFG